MEFVANPEGAVMLYWIVAGRLFGAIVKIIVIFHK
jgi:hypothetical protein